MVAMKAAQPAVKKTAPAPVTPPFQSATPVDVPAIEFITVARCR